MSLSLLTDHLSFRHRHFHCLNDARLFYQRAGRSQQEIGSRRTNVAPSRGDLAEHPTARPPRMRVQRFLTHDQWRGGTGLAKSIRRGFYQLTLRERLPLVSARMKPRASSGVEESRVAFLLVTIAATRSYSIEQSAVNRSEARAGHV